MYLTKDCEVQGFTLACWERESEGVIFSSGGIYYMYAKRLQTLQLFRVDGSIYILYDYNDHGVDNDDDDSRPLHQS